MEVEPWVARTEQPRMDRKEPATEDTTMDLDTPMEKYSQEANQDQLSISTNTTTRNTGDRDKPKHSTITHNQWPRQTLHDQRLPTSEFRSPVIIYLPESPISKQHNPKPHPLDSLPTTPSHNNQNPTSGLSPYINKLNLKRTGEEMDEQPNIKKHKAEGEPRGGEKTRAVGDNGNLRQGNDKSDRVQARRREGD